MLLCCAVRSHRFFPAVPNPERHPSHKPHPIPSRKPLVRSYSQRATRNSTLRTLTPHRARLVSHPLD
ncbi:hypothetical protein P154DRAFT_519213 [Amniculicola lignicola CBS 123094]|uniref:Uncharacterized protein n=1 Tax=Amniculicola lignicola CBS 123094 TaxID=1392246 RepID=A0A6A5WSD2_9PLEO|nr:hypothetical protein P154DRAFT_519213 [Amniculicola lignicola CBS 123094]